MELIRTHLLKTAAFLLVLFSSVLSAQEHTWIKMKKSGLTVMVSKDADLAKLYNNLRSRASGMDKAPENISKKEQAGLLLDRMNAVLMKVNKLNGVDQPLKGVKRVVVFRDWDELNKAFKKRYGREFKDGLSFYDRSTNTVYTAQTIMEARILAHEFTHLVNDLVFGRRISLRKDEQMAYKNEVHF